MRMIFTSKESYFKAGEVTSVVSGDPEEEDEEETTEINESMAQYLTAIRKTSK